jgi:hypothetical protein
MSSRGGSVSALAQQVGQLCDIRRNPSRLILGEQLGRRTSTRLLLEIDAGNALAVLYEALQDRRQIVSAPIRAKMSTIKSALALNGVKP